MPQIETWSRLPVALRDHLVQRMHDRNISVNDLDFGSFKLCGEGKYPKTFLLAGQLAVGRKL